MINSRWNSHFLQHPFHAGALLDHETRERRIKSCLLVKTKPPHPWDELRWVENAGLLKAAGDRNLIPSVQRQFSTDRSRKKKGGEERMSSHEKKSRHLTRLCSELHAVQVPDFYLCSESQQSSSDCLRVGRLCHRRLWLWLKGPISCKAAFPMFFWQ